MFLAYANAVRWFFFKLRLQVVKHRRKVNGLIKLERNLWIADKADQLDAAFASGNMHGMYKHLGAIIKYARIRIHLRKYAELVIPMDPPLSRMLKRSWLFVVIFPRRCQQKPSLNSEGQG